MKHVRWKLAVTSAVLALLLIAYRLSFRSLYAMIGEPAFLLGWVPCFLAASVLGIRGALVAIAVVATIDRDHALIINAPGMGPTVGLIALLAKLVLVGGLGLVRDSHRRIRGLNAQLREQVAARERSEQLYRALVDSLGEGVGLFDAEDRVVFANQALADTLKTPHGELLGRSFSGFLVEESRGRVSGEAPQPDAKHSYEVVLQNAASTALLVTETKFTSGAGQEARTLRVVRDLTERIVSERRQRELERELQRSQALQSLAVMAGGVAHDFNNLLCGVVGNAEVAQRKVPDGAPPVLGRCLAEILAFASEAAQLSKQMLAYAGRRSLGIEALDSNVEIATALRLLHATVESKARLVLDFGDRLPMVAADPFQLRQVVTNLVLNSLDAMAGRRGVLTLRTGAVCLAATQATEYGLTSGDYVKISVEDTGSGIPAEARERLFEPFFSTKAAGRGMGLAAAAGIVRAHRGWLGVDSTSELGTRFGMLLPLAPGSVLRRTSPPPAAGLPAAGRNILLIDDEPAVRIVTGRLLGELGHHVLTAEDGQRGLQLLREQQGAIDVVVLDLTMPERSGEQILADLRLLREDLPVVITSGFQATDASELLRLPNVIGFLDKPHTLAKLEMALAAVELGAAQ